MSDPGAYRSRQRGILCARQAAADQGAGQAKNVLERAAENVHGPATNARARALLLSFRRLDSLFLQRHLEDVVLLMKVVRSGKVKLRGREIIHQAGRWQLPICEQDVLAGLARDNTEPQLRRPALPSSEQRRAIYFTRARHERPLLSEENV